MTPPEDGRIPPVWEGIVVYTRGGQIQAVDFGAPNVWVTIRPGDVDWDEALRIAHRSWSTPPGE